MHKAHIARPRYSKGAQKKANPIDFLLEHKRFLVFFAVVTLLLLFALGINSYKRISKNSELFDRMNIIIAKEINKIYPNTFPDGSCTVTPNQGNLDDKSFEALLCLYSICSAAQEKKRAINHRLLLEWVSERFPVLIYDTYNHEDIYKLIKEMRMIFELGESPEFHISHKGTPGFFLHFPVPDDKDALSQNAPFGYVKVGTSYLCTSGESQCLLSSFDADFINRTDIKVKKPIFIVIETTNGGVFVKKLRPTGLKRKRAVSFRLHSEPITRFRYRVYFSKVPKLYENAKKI